MPCPHATVPFFQRHGFETSTYTIPTSVDEQIREAGVGILTYRYGGSARMHTVTVQYVPGTHNRRGGFYVFNAYAGDTAPRVFHSIDEWLRGEHQQDRTRVDQAIALTTIR